MNFEFGLKKNLPINREALLNLNYFSLSNRVPAGIFLKHIDHHALCKLHLLYLKSKIAN